MSDVIRGENRMKPKEVANQDAELLPQVKLIPVSSTWTCPTCRRQNAYAEGILHPQNICGQCGTKVQIGVTRADSGYVRGLEDAAKVARNHRHADDQDSDPFCSNYGCRNGIAEDIRALIPTAQGDTAPKICNGLGAVTRLPAPEKTK